MNYKFLCTALIALASFTLFGCSGGGGGGGANGGTMTVSTSAAAVTEGSSISATAVIIPTQSGVPVNNLDVVFSHNFPKDQGDLIHFATYAASNVGSSTLAVKTDALGNAFVILNVDNSVTLPAAGVDVTITAACSGLSSAITTVHINPITGSGGTVVPKISLALSNASIASDTGQSIATATVTDQSGNPLSGKTVTFTQAPIPSTPPNYVNITTINSGTTDSSGKAYAILAANTVTTQTTVFITASVNGILITSQLTITPGPGGGSATPTGISISIDNTILTGGQNALATVTVTDASGNPVSGKTVNFSTQPSPSDTIQIIPPTAVTTDSKGKAIAIVQGKSVSSSTYGIVVASVASTSLSISTSVQVNPVPAAGKPRITLTLNPATVDPTVGQVDAIATILDPNGTPVSGVPITFTIVSGEAAIKTTPTDYRTVSTGADGIARSIIIPGTPKFSTNVIVSISLSYLGTPYALTATFVEQPTLNMTLSLSPTSVNTGQQVIGTAKLTNASGAAIANQPVAFSVVSGPATLIGSTLTTATDGTAQAVFAPTTTTTVSSVLVKVTTTFNGVDYTQNAIFQVNASNIVLTLTANDITAAGQIDTNGTVIDGLTTGVNIKAKFSYLDGVPIPNQLITFTALSPNVFWGSSGGGGIGSTTTASTTTSGEAFAVLVPGTFPADGFVYVQASTVVQSVTYTQILPIKVLKTTVSLDFQLDKAAVTVNPGINNDVHGTFTLKDSTGNPVSGQTVTFSVSSGPATILAPAAPTTDGNGQATVTIRPTAPITQQTTVIVNAQVTVNGVAFNRLAQFTVNPLVKLSLVTDLARIDTSGQVVATATLLDANNAPISNQVTFSILAGPASITGSATPTTSVTDGTAQAIITTTDTASTSNVLVQVSTTLAGQTYSKVTTFEVVRGTGSLNLSAPPVTASTITGGTPGNPFSWVVTMPFTLLDGNGNPRVGVPVTLSVFSFNNGVFTIIGTNPVTTDAKGTGIFNVEATVLIPSLSNQNNGNVVWKVVTNDATPIIGYATSLYTITNSP